MSERWRKVAQADDVKDGAPHRIVVDETEIALHRLGAEIFATANICTHAWARLSDGYTDGDAVICPMHEGGFDIRTGAALYAPCSEPLRVFAVKVEDGDVYLDCEKI